MFIWTVQWLLKQLFLFTVGSWFISPVLSGLMSVVLFKLIHHFILLRPHPLVPGLRALPLFYGITIIVNVFSVVHNGPKCECSIIILLYIPTNITSLPPPPPLLFLCWAGVVFETLPALLHKMGVLSGCDTVSLDKWPQCLEGLQCLTTGRGTCSTAQCHIAEVLHPLPCSYCCGPCG